MKLPARLKSIGKIGRAVLFPMGNVPTHLGFLTRYTAQELGIQLQLVQRLEALAQETCQESGLTPAADWDKNHRLHLDRGDLAVTNCDGELKN